MKVVIVNAFGRSNRGDAVLLDECIGQLRVVYPEAEIFGVVFEGIPEAEAVHPTVEWSERIGSTKQRGATAKLRTLGYMLLAWISAKAPWSGFDRLLPADQRRTLSTLRDADIVISAPGGYIHDTNFAYFVALFHIHLGTLFGKTVVLAPQSVGPISRPFPRWIARRVLSKVPYLCARESYSYGFLTNELAIDASQVYRAGDSAFWNDEVERDPAVVDRELARLGVPAGRGIFGMTVVSWPFPRHQEPGKAHDAYVAAVSRIADEIVEKYNLIPVIFNQVSEDLSTARDVCRTAKHPIIVDEQSRDPSVLRALIARSTLFLGTRFHSCIFAMMAGRPIFAIAYLPKTEFIMNDLSLGTRHTPIGAVDVNSVLAKLSLDFANLPAAESEICTAIAAYRQRFTRLCDILTLAEKQRRGDEHAPVTR